MHERTLTTRTVFEGRIFDVDRLEVELADGTRSVRDIVRHRGAVGVVAERPDGRFLFVRQFRKAHDRELLEIVAGTLDDREEAATCAAREVREETGHDATALTPLGVILPSPGYVDETIALFHARLADARHEQDLDRDERVDVVALLPEEIERAIDSGELNDAKSLAAWHLHTRRLRRAP